MYRDLPKTSVSNTTETYMMSPMNLGRHSLHSGR